MISRIYNVVIADDHPVVCEGLKLILESDPEIKVIACVENGLLAYNACKNHQIDVVLMDIVMPELDGIEAAKMIQELNNDTKILILTSIPDGQKIKEALNSNVHGYILKDADPKDIIRSVKNTANGIISIKQSILDEFLNNCVQTKESNGVYFEDLSQHEREILSLIANGYENKEIAEELHLSSGTVKVTITNLLVKYNLKNRTQLAVFAIKNGFGS
jgi:DNA-binding NarL/FixJ family response regulator